MRGLYAAVRPFSLSDVAKIGPRRGTSLRNTPETSSLDSRILAGRRVDGRVARGAVAAEQRAAAEATAVLGRTGGDLAERRGATGGAPGAVAQARGALR